MKVLFTYNYGREKIKAIEDLGYEVIIKDEKTITYSEELDDVEGIGEVRAKKIKEGFKLIKERLYTDRHL